MKWCKDPHRGDGQENNVEDDLTSGYAAFEDTEMCEYRNLDTNDKSTQRSQESHH
jgi:hypothetical protein